MPPFKIKKTLPENQTVSVTKNERKIRDMDVRRKAGC